MTSKDIDAERTILVRISDVFLGGNLAPLLIVQSLIGDAVALWATPRAEEPRSSSPMADPTVRFVVAEPLTRDLYAWPLNSRNENSLIET